MNWSDKYNSGPVEAPPARFPTLAIDNFYEDPIAVRQWALSLPFDDDESNNTGKYPGTRTKILNEIDPVFFDSFCKKLFSVYFDFEFANIEWHVSTAFQLLYPDKDPTLNVGWAHQDDSALFAGLIYLDEDADIDAGTTIGEIKNARLTNEEWNELQEIRKDYYLGKLKTEDEISKYRSRLEYNSSLYTETAEFKNVFNRLISYDGTQNHRANFGNDSTKPRLTQVFFVNAFKSNSQPPLIRVKNHKTEWINEH